MSDYPKNTPSESASLAIIQQKTRELTTAAASMRPDALRALAEIRNSGLPVYISGSIDLTGSMFDDIIFVNTGVAQFIQNYVAGLPADLTNALGGNFLKVTGAVIKHRDVDEDFDESFRMTLFPKVIPSLFVQYSSNIRSGDASGGGDTPESQLISLLMTLGIPRSNPQVQAIFQQIYAKISTGKLQQRLPTPNFNIFVGNYDAYTRFPKRPELVYMVTDAPPKNQFGVDSRMIAGLARQTQLPKMVFFVREFKHAWEPIARDLGASIFDLEKAGDARVATSNVADFISRTAGTALLDSINRQFPRLGPPKF